MNEHGIIGWGADRDLASRPGVPRRKPGSVPALKHAPEWMQGATSEIHPPDSPPTPVYSTALPLGYVRPSAWLKRLAYRIPQDKSEHWLLLVLSDRFDVLEHRVKPLALLALGVGAIAFTAGMIRAPAAR